MMGLEWGVKQLISSCLCHLIVPINSDIFISVVCSTQWWWLGCACVYFCVCFVQRKGTLSLNIEKHQAHNSETSKSIHIKPLSCPFFSSLRFEALFEITGL